MDNQKSQVLERLTQATNILVTVSSNPSVDQLSAAIGLSLLLNHQGKHATAVFSGNVPSTIEFLQPEKTLEKTTDSLRDFIIALDKSKADKLRYKLEDQVVKIFITPYRTSISDKDLEFSQGDFNVEVVVALGVNDQAQLDQAITAHGRILHDATVIGLSTNAENAIGSLNWNDAAASSLCEMVMGLGLTSKASALDAQTATALLTGIVAETERFSNEKTSSETMQISSKLMAAGANQQLVASQLQKTKESPAVDQADLGAPAPEPQESVASTDEEPAELPEPAPDAEPAEPASTDTSEETKVSEPASTSSADGSLQISHGENKIVDGLESLNDDDSQPDVEQIHIDEEGVLQTASEIESIKQKTIQPLPSPDLSTTGQTVEQPKPDGRLVLDPPVLGGKLTANTEPETLDPSTDPLGLVASTGPMLSHAGARTPAMPSDDPSVRSEQPSPDSLSDLEKAVQSPHLQATSGPEIPGEDVNAARDAVVQAMTSSTPQLLEPVQALNAQPMDLNLGQQIGTPPVIHNTTSMPAQSASDLPEGLVPPDPGLPVDMTATNVTNPTAPPPVPPPMMPPMPAPRPGDTAL